MKNFLPKTIFVTIIALALSANSVLAASLSLTKIGALNIGNKQISGQWYYTSTNPTLYGTAGEGSNVVINIDGTEGSATADASGNWQFYSDKLTNGNHQVAISSGSESFGFSLNIGQDVPADLNSATVSASGNAVPVTGSTSSLITYVGISAALLMGGVFLLNKKRSS